MFKELSGWRLAMTLALFSGACSVHAFEFSADAYSEVDYSDNVRRESRDRLDELTQIFGLNVGFKQDGTVIDALADIQIEKEVYYEGVLTGGNDTLATGFAELNVDIIDSFFSWQTSGSRTEFLNDPLANDIPDNQVHRDIVRTGPRFNYKLTRTTFFSLSSNYVNVENSDPDDADTERTESQISLLHNYNSATSFSVSTTYDKVVDAEGGERLTDFGWRAGFTRDFARGDMSFEYGRTSLRPEFSDKLNSNFFEFEFSKRDVYFHDINIVYTQDVTDSSIGFRVDEQSAVGEDTRLRSVTENDIVERRTFSIGASRALQSFTYNIEAFIEEEDFEFLRDDERSRGVDVSLNQVVSSKISTGYRYGYELRNFVDQPVLVGKEILHELEADVRYDFSEDLFFGGSVSYTVRRGGANPLRSFEELGIGLSMNWKLL